MLKGHTFNLQTFTSEAFAIFIDKFLNGNSGVATGCTLSNTTTSVTISDGFFVVRGRFLQVIGSETIKDITEDGFYSLVCEIDLSKQNTKKSFNQAAIKTVYSASNYLTLTQQDITNDGIIYQYEFARFKVESGSITSFVDRRTFIDFQSVLDLIQAQANEVLDEIKQALSDVLDESVLGNYALKTEIGTMASKNYLIGTNPPNAETNADVYDQYF